MKILSVIISIYGTEPYVDRCFSSLVVPDDLMAKLEVIMVDNATKDNAMLHAQKYADKYPDTFKIYHVETNNYYGSGINEGLRHVNGKYVRLLDSDDWVDTSAFEKYMRQLEVVDSDMVITDFNKVYDDGKICRNNTFPMPKGKTMPYEEYDDLSVYFAMHALTYRSSILKEHSFYLSEGFTYTDTEWVFFPQCWATTITYFPFSVYQYLIGREGQTMDPKVLLKSTWHYDKLLRSMIQFSNALPSEKRNSLSYTRLENQIAHLSMGVYRTCLVLQSADSWNKELLISFDAFMKERRPSIYRAATKLTLTKYLPIHYVRYWRITGHRFSVDWIRDTFRKIRYGRKK